MDDDVRQGGVGARGGGGSSGWDRSPRNGGSRYPRRDDDDLGNGGRGGSYGRGGRAGGSARGDWDDPRGSRGGPPDRSGDRMGGDRSMRAGRPPVRNDWDAPARGRGGPGGPGGPGYSGSSRRPPQGGGLWGDAPRGRPGVRDPRDPRAPRGRFAEPEEEEGGLTFAKGAGAVFGMFVLGVAVAFALFMLNKPTPQLDNTPPAPTNTAAPVATPSVTPKVTPTTKGSVPGIGPAYVLVATAVKS